MEPVYVSVAEYQDLLAAVGDKEVRTTVDWLKRYPVSEVDDARLEASARQSLALVVMVDKYGLSRIAIDDSQDRGVWISQGPAYRRRGAIMGWTLRRSSGSCSQS